MNRTNKNRMAKLEFQTVKNKRKKIAKVIYKSNEDDKATIFL